MQENNCITCHGESLLWDGERRRLYVSEEHLANDIHWEKGLRRQDCHGGDPTTRNFPAAHDPGAGFRAIKSPRDIPDFCGHCHSNLEYMRRFEPSPKTNQAEEYWTSGHGLRLLASDDPQVATCVSCHGRHGIRAVKDLQSPVYPTRVAQTCAGCHADPNKMEGRIYNGRPIGHFQYQNWRTSVHGEALLKKGDTSAPTCNDCHGNHGALPPEVGSVANTCGSCHAKTAGLFAQTQMKHRLDELHLPGCSSCHGSHGIQHPSDNMLGMQAGAVCTNCHAEGRFGATIAGAREAREMRTLLEKLKQEIHSAHEAVSHAERLGMEVRGPRFDLNRADTSLTSARTLIHSFALEPVKEKLTEGLEVTAAVKESAREAMEEYTYRRIWLAVSLAPILVVVGLLLLAIRALPPTDQ